MRRSDVVQDPSVRARCSSPISRFGWDEIEPKGTPRWRRSQESGGAYPRRGARALRRIEDIGRGGRDGVLPAAKRERRQEGPVGPDGGDGGDVTSGSKLPFPPHKRSRRRVAWACKNEAEQPVDSVDTFHFFIFHLHQEFESQQVWIGRARAESCVRVPTKQDSSRESSSRVEREEAPVKPRTVEQVTTITQAAPHVTILCDAWPHHPGPEKGTRTPPKGQ